jgi:DNA replication protein DnaC
MTQRDVTVELKALRLHGMAGAWADLVEQGGNAALDSSRWLIEHLLQAEGTDRAMRSVSHQMHAARFPVHRDMAGFDFEVSPVDRKLVGSLATAAFTEDAHNVVLVGGPGTGKTHLATAIGVSGITRHGKCVRFYSTVDLVNALEQEKAQGKAGRIALSLLRMDLVILDELGYLPFSQAGGALLFHLLSRLYEHQRDDHDQPGLRRMVQRVRRREDDHRVAGPPDAPLPHRGDGQRVDPLQPQHGPGQEADQGARAGSQGRQDRGGGRPLLNSAARGKPLRATPCASSPARSNHHRGDQRTRQRPTLIHSRRSQSRLLPLAQYWIGTVAQI